MSTRMPRERLLDILEAIEEIEQFTAGMTLDEFESDRKTLKAVMANFAIVGEAAGHLPKVLTDKYPDVPWAVMRAMRNRMVHVYFAISPLILWETVQNDLPPLIKSIQGLLSELDD